MEDVLIMRRVNVHINGGLRHYLDSGVMANGLRVYRQQVWNEPREGEPELVNQWWSTEPKGGVLHASCEELMRNEPQMTQNTQMNALAGEADNAEARKLATDGTDDTAPSHPSTIAP